MALSSQTKETILVADDEASIRRILETRLSMIGYKVVTASDGKEALKLFKDYEPDLVVLDVMMPKLDGYGVCQELRKDSDVDLVLVCLPHSWLATMRWDGEQLRNSMVKHVAYFDRPAHYLRVSILFDEPFWGEKIPGAWFMSEAFGGCCVYNEGARHDVGKHGVLNWLIAGSDALA